MLYFWFSSSYETEDGSRWTVSEACFISAVASRSFFAGLCLAPGDLRSCSCVCPDGYFLSVGADSFPW